MPSSSSMPRVRARRAAIRGALGERAPLGPVDGLPLTIKDNIIWRRHAGPPRLAHAADRAGRRERAIGRPSAQAGAILIGKTTTPEFGWKGVGDSPLTGITRNPWNTRARPGGSSAAAPRRRPLLNLGVAASRHRRRRLDPHPGGVHRRLRHQAELRPRAGLSGLALRRRCRMSARSRAPSPTRR